MARATGVYRYEYNRTQVANSSSANNYAMVGQSKRGRVDKPTRFTDATMFEEVYGTPDHRQGLAAVGAAALMRYVPTYFMRVVGGAFEYSNSAFCVDDNGQQFQQVSFTNRKKPLTTVDWPAAGADNLQAAFAVVAIGPGSDYDNLKIRVTSLNMPEISGMVADAVPDNNSILPAGARKFAVVAFNNLGPTYAAVMPSVTLTAGDAAVLKWNRVPGASGYMIFLETTIGGTAAYRQYATVSQVAEAVGTVTYFDTGDGTINPNQKLGTVGSNLGLIAEEDATGTPTKLRHYEKVQEFTLSVNDTKNGVAESFLVTFNPSRDGFDQQQEITERVNNETVGSRLIRVVKNPMYVPTADYQDANGNPCFYSSPAVSLTGGADGSAPSSGDYQAAINLAYRNEDEIQIMKLVAGGNPMIQSMLAEIADQRKDCSAILAVPTEYQQGSSPVNYRTDILQLNNERAVLSTGDVEWYDSYSDTNISMSPDIVTAITRAIADGAWGTFHPAFGPSFGVVSNIPEVKKLKVAYGKDELNSFANAQINPIINKAGFGLLLADQWTLSSKLTAMSHWSVRTMVDIATVSIMAALYTLVGRFPGDDMDRDAQTFINQILGQLKNQNAIKDYRIFVGDVAGNTPDLAIQGIRKYKVVLVPNVPVREIELHTYITKDSVDMDEVIQDEAA